jgi:hypothetical protein
VAEARTWFDSAVAIRTGGGVILNVNNAQLLGLKLFL